MDFYGHNVNITKYWLLNTFTLTVSVIFSLFLGYSLNAQGNKSIPHSSIFQNDSIIQGKTQNGFNKKIRKIDLQIADQTDFGQQSITQIQNNIESSEYRISRISNNNSEKPIDFEKEIFQAPNRNHAMRTWFSESGIRVTSRESIEKKWDWGLKFSAYGSEGNMIGVTSANTIIDKI